MKNCECGEQFTPRQKNSRFCSQRCYWRSLVGQPGKKRRGRHIECQLCMKVFYVPPSRLGSKRFCSRNCQLNHQRTIIKEKKCVICNEAFVVKGLSRYTKTTCSSSCHAELARRITRVSIEKRKKQMVLMACKFCGQQGKTSVLYKKKYCSLQCQYHDMKERRVGKGNPNHRSGIYGKNGLYAAGSKTLGRHLRACAKYRKEFIQENGYQFCEVCKKNQSMRFDVHHIYYASRFPKHPQLHNSKNLIHICRDCHLAFHGNQLKETFEQLEETRGLKGLFGITK